MNLKQALVCILEAFVLKSFSLILIIAWFFEINKAHATHKPYV